MNTSRRSFLATSAFSTASLAFSARGNAQAHDMGHMQHGPPKPERPSVPRLPALLCKMTGTVGIDTAFKMLMEGKDTLDAALHVCTTQEDDPKDHSTGVGALPNAQGVIQLDGCCFHGPTRRAAAVGAVTGIRSASLLARALMDGTGNASLVGSDAQAFALARGFVKEELDTPRSRQTYELWRKISANSSSLGTGSYDPSWPEPLRKAHFLPQSQKQFDLLIRTFEPLAVELGLEPAMSWRAVFDALAPSSQAVYVSAIDRNGQISSACTSSGQPWRLPGVMSDVASLGAGCFLDPEVGSAGASGSAEASIKIAGAHTIVENMRMGMSPEEAGLDALRRIVRLYGNSVDALRFVEVVYYIMRKDGAYAGVSLWQGDRTGHVRQFTVIDGEATRRTEECVPLFPCSPFEACSALHA